MALREVRMDLNTPLYVVDAFMGTNHYRQYDRGEPTRIVVDGHPTPFTYHPVKTTHPTTRPVVGGVYTEYVVGRAETRGLYDEALTLEWTYATFKDNVYRQTRPMKATLTLSCPHFDRLRYPPHEIFALVTATFREI